MCTIFTYLSLLVSVCVYICGTFSEGILFPCSKKHTEFKNRTLWARLNESASITICAESYYTVYQRFKITHPNHGDGWYPQPYRVDERLNTSVTNHNRQLTVFITVKNVQLADFDEPFHVTVFSADNGTQLNDSATIYFSIEETGNLHDVCYGKMDNNDTTVVTTTKIPPTSSEFLIDPNNPTTWCPDSGYTQDLCSVTSDVQFCVWVLTGNSHFTPKDQCAPQNAYHISNIEIMKKCLAKRLYFKNVTTSRLDETRYVNIQNWTDGPPAETYHVGCLKGSQPLTNPAITLFTLELWDTQSHKLTWTYNLLGSNNRSVTIPATNNTVNVTCRATGYPKPEVVILRDNETLDMIPSGSSLIRSLNDSFSGVFTCQATNVLNLGQTHIRAMVSVSDCTPETNSTQSQTDYWLLVAVGITVGTIALVLICVFFKKKGTRVVVAGKRGVPDRDRNEEVVIDNMELYSIGKNEVVIDNMALYGSFKREENSAPDVQHGHNDDVVDNTYSLASSSGNIAANDFTDCVNLYEDVKESVQNDEDVIKATSHQGVSECGTSHTDEVGSRKSPDRTNNNYTQVVKHTVSVRPATKITCENNTG